MISLSRALVFFDLETTGVDPFNDRIVQIAAVKYMPDNSQTEKNWLINPGIPIPKVVSDIHGITDDTIRDKPRLGDLTAELSETFMNADLGGYNVRNFDIPLLQTEFNRIGLSLDTEKIKIVDSMQIFKMKEPRTLTAAYQKYCGKEMINAHDALTDIRASIEVFHGQMNMYTDLPQSIDGLHEYCFPADPHVYDVEGKLKFADGILTINFGKNRGKPLQELAVNDPGYLEWILNGSFSEKVKEAVREVLKK